MEFEDHCVTWSLKHTMGHLLWCAVHFIEIFGLFWCSAHPHSWIPYVKIGFNMHLYINVLFSRESLEELLSSSFSIQSVFYEGKWAISTSENLLFNFHALVGLCTCCCARGRQVPTKVELENGLHCSPSACTGPHLFLSFIFACLHSEPFLTLRTRTRKIPESVYNNYTVS
jgi:hypothetical protein